MTVAVVVKVFDGIVLAADSATTLPLTNGGAQVYNNANKIFHLHRQRPIGAMTWGLGSIGSASIATLSKDLRRRLMGLDASFPDWELDDTYTVEGVAERLVQMFYDELFLAEHPDPNDPPPSPLFMLVAGYSAGQNQAEAWVVELERAGKRPVPKLSVAHDASGYIAFAQPEAVERLFGGIDPRLADSLKQQFVDGQLHAGFDQEVQRVYRDPVVPYMPFGDAIDLARFLVDTTSGYVKFLLGANTVGGVAEVAGISRHEGFRWINRKHYYPAHLNPVETGHDG